MTKILLTAFEPYDQWTENSSWLTLVELTRWYDPRFTLITRRYPVDLVAVNERVRKDLMDGFDFAVYLGQSPGSVCIRLESTGLNMRTDGQPLIEGSPAAYTTPLPLQQLKQAVLAERIPIEISHHAGTYLCNALLYLSQHVSSSFKLPTRSLFVHLPLTPEQVASSQVSLPSAAANMMSKAIAKILDTLTQLEQPMM